MQVSQGTSQKTFEFETKDYFITDVVGKRLSGQDCDQLRTTKQIFNVNLDDVTNLTKKTLRHFV